MIPRILTALALSLLLIGCKKKTGPSCREAGEHVIDLLRNELAKEKPGERLSAAQANLPTLKDALIRTCETKNWSQSSRQCILDAKSAAETEACDPGIQAPSTSADSGSTQD